MNVEKTIEYTLNRLEGVYHKDGIEIERKFNASDVKIIGNQGRFQQVLMNSITNSRDALRGIGEPKITVDTRLVGDKLEIEVSDNGQGIAPEVQDKVFKKYFTTKE